jgi:hypothetical protein
MDDLVRTPTRRLLFIVSPERMDLYERLRQALIREPDVDLIVDRRGKDRRLLSADIEREHRGLQRRQRAAVDEEIRECGWAVVSIPRADAKTRRRATD